MSKRQRNLKHSLEEEKSRVKLYKSGKHWIKSGIKEIKLMQIMGLPIFSNHTSEGPDETQDKGNFVKKCYKSYNHSWWRFYSEHVT